MAGRRVRRPDPLEREVEDALIASGLQYLRGDQQVDVTKRLDFYIVPWRVHVEVKQMHTARVAEQMSRAPDVIVLQGWASVRLFCKLLKGEPI